LARFAEARRRHDQFAGLRVVGLFRRRFALHEVPNKPIAHGDHVAKLVVFAREGFGIPRAAAAVDVPAVHHAIVLFVMPRLIVHRGADFVGERLVDGRRIAGAEERGVEGLSN